MGEIIYVWGFSFALTRLGTWAIRRMSVYKGLCLVPWDLRSTECVGLRSGFERWRVSGNNLTITCVRTVLCQVSGTLWLLRARKEWFIRHFRHPPPRTWCRRLTVRLRGVGWNLVTDVSGHSSRSWCHRPTVRLQGRRLEFGYQRFGTFVPSSKFTQSKKNYLPDTTVNVIGDTKLTFKILRICCSIVKRSARTAQ